MEALRQTNERFLQRMTHDTYLGMLQARVTVEQPPPVIQPNVDFQRLVEEEIQLWDAIAKREPQPDQLLQETARDVLRKR